MSQVVQRAKAVLLQEAAALQRLSEQIGIEYDQAVQVILNIEGKVVVTGMGKAGHIGKKIAASLASTGTSAFFVHPAEALHGDSGMVTEQDLVLAISNSGETAEVLSFLTIVQQLGAPIIAITGGLRSSLSKIAAITLAADVEHEADPLNLAPTTSALAELAVGDALVVCLMVERGFIAKDFQCYHPGGALGKRLA